MRRSTQNFYIPPPPPSGKAQAFELLKTGLFKFSPPLARIVFKLPALLSDLSAKCPSLRTITAIIKLVYKHANTSHDPLYDDAVFTRLELLQKHNLNIETRKNDLN